MDSSQFDRLSRRFVEARTRRQALKALAGAITGIVIADRRVEAQSCASPYSPCQADGQCCAGAVCEYGLCMPGCRVAGAFVSAGISPPDNICGICDPAISTTSLVPANEGMSCWSGDPTAGATFCQSGECRPTGPAQCPPPPACHTDELIDPATCAYAVAEAGTVCGREAMCHGGFYQPADTCDGNGVCIGGGSQAVNCAPYACGTDSCLTSCASAGDCVGGTTCCAGTCVSLDSIEHCGSCGNACPTESDNACLGEAVCRQGACGFMPQPRGTACGDSNACNGTEACDGRGVCQPGLPVACASCTTCNPASGVCEADTSQDGTSCPGDGNQCYGAFVCDAGICTGTDEVVCNAPDACHVAGTCQPGTGVCSPPVPTTDFQNDSNNCGSCGNVCSAPANATATCSAGICGFDCDDGYEPTAAGDACCPVGELCCPAGYEALNGGCFRINNSGGSGVCAATCTSTSGSIDGSVNFLCVNILGGASCTQTSDCPTGSACQTNLRRCVSAC